MEHGDVPLPLLWGNSFVLRGTPHLSSQRPRRRILFGNIAAAVGRHADITTHETDPPDNRFKARGDRKTRWPQARSACAIRRPGMKACSWPCIPTTSSNGNR